MTEDTYTLKMAPYERERTLDWLTALVPLLLISILYYGWRAVLLEVLAVGGYLVVSALFSGGLATVRLAPALVTGLLCAFCLPATTPYWPAALAGGVAALVAAIPGFVAKKWPHCPYARPLIQPAMAGYLLVRLVFPGAVDAFTLPIQWDNLDGVATATPLAALAGEKMSLTSTSLFFGIHAGAIGEGCAAAVCLCGLYLLIRRRIRLIAPATMLVVIALLSWVVWGTPLYAVLAGGAVLGALLLADCDTMPRDYATQTASGVLAGGIVVLLRALTFTDGTAVALVAVGLLQPVMPAFFQFCRWLWSVLQPVLDWIWKWFCRGVAWLWTRLKAGVATLLQKCRKQ